MNFSFVNVAWSALSALKKLSPVQRRDEPISPYIYGLLSCPRNMLLPMFQVPHWVVYETTKAMATATSLNKRINERNSGCARGL